MARMGDQRRGRPGRETTRPFHRGAFFKKGLRATARRSPCRHSQDADELGAR
jgi:hypothetical protein